MNRNIIKVIAVVFAIVLTLSAVAACTKTYTITFDTKGGEPLSSMDVNPKDGFNLPDPVKTGYTFVEWYVDSDLLTLFDENGEIKSNITLYAAWEANEYTITFDEKGGSAVSDITADCDAAVTVPAVPIKDSYTFSGWYANESCTGSEYAFTSMPAGGLTLYAKWTPVEYTITYVLDGGDNNAANPSTYTIESEISLAVPVKEDFGFDGWFIDEGFETSISTIAERTGNLTLYALWYGIYNIEYVLNGGENNANNPTSYGFHKGFSIYNPTRLGYRFINWCGDEALNSPTAIIFYPEWNTSGDITFYAAWEIETYDITYVLDGGDNDPANPETYTVEDGIGFEAPDKESFDFEGWYLDAGFTSPLNEILPGAIGDITLYAHWTPSEYTITFIENGGSEVNDINALSGNTVSAPSAPTRTAYEFVAWHLEGDAEPYVFSTMPAEDFSLYAEWEAVEYNINYVLDGGENNGSNPESYTIEDEFTLADPEKVNYDFGGWYADAGFLAAADIEFSGRMGEVTVYARWYELYDITYMLNGGDNSEANQERFSYITEEFAIADATREGYEFIGWYSDEQLTEEADIIIEQGSSGDITFYAGWTEIYEISYYLDGGENNLANPASYTVLSEEILISIPRKTGYSFLGWYSDSEFINPADTTIETGNEGALAFYASWQINEYSISFYTLCEYVVETITQDYGTAVTAPADPEYTPEPDSYVFAGWYIDLDYSEEYEFLVMPEEYVMLYAKWECLYEVSVDNDGKATIVGCSSKLIGDIELPSLIGGREVIAIMEGAFANNPRITGFTSDIQSLTIGDGAFLNCTEMQTFNLTGTTNIGSGILEGCENLYIITLPFTADSTLAYYLGLTEPSYIDTLTVVTDATSLAAMAFYQFDTVAEIEIVSETLTNIGTSAFEGCSSLQSIALPGTITSTGNYAFTNCSSLVAINLTSCDAPGTAILSGCSSLTSVTLNFELYTLNSYFGAADASELPEGLASVTIASDSQSIVAYALDGCAATSIVIPESVTSIGDYALSNMGITELTVPESVTSIGRYAFADCVNLTSVTLNCDAAAVGYQILKGDTALSEASLPFLDTFSSSTASFLGYYFEGNLSSYIYGIPVSLETITVTGTTVLPNNAFKSCIHVKTVNLPSNLVSIGASALEGTTAMLGITLPDTLTSIGASAFSYSGIESVELPDTLDTMGQWAFANTKLTEITLPAALTYIPDNAFYEATALEFVTPPETLTSIGQYAFYNTKIASLLLPDFITSIGQYAFGNCASLTTAVIEAPTSAIGGNLFTGCSALESLIAPLNAVYSAGTPSYIAYYFGGASKNEYGKVPASLTNIEVTGVTTLPANAFYSLSNVEGIILPDDLTSIGGSAFYNTTSMTSIVFPETLASMGSGAFWASGLSGSVTLPDSLVTIGSYAFRACASLTGITFGSGLDTIETYAFYDCAALDGTVDLSGSAVTDIESMAFANCAALDGALIPASTICGYGLFNGCVNIQSLTVSLVPTYDAYSRSYLGWYFMSSQGAGYAAANSLVPSSLKSVTVLNVPVIPTKGVANYAFYNCAHITEVNLPAEDTLIGTYTFYGCSALTAITLPSPLAAIGTYAFSNSGLTAITIPSGVSVIAEGVFQDCAQLASVTFSGTIGTIGESAFSECVSLAGITLSAGLSSIGESAFYSSGLESVEIPAGINTIGDYAFSSCVSLTSAILPVMSASGTPVGTGIFTGCSHLGTLTVFFQSAYVMNKPTYLGYYFGHSTYESVSSIPSSLHNVTVRMPAASTTLGDYSFYNCYNLTEIALPDTIVNIQASTFENCTRLETINIPANLETIGGYAFKECDALATVTLPEFVTTIGASAFYGCGSLSSAVLPAGLTSIGSRIFEYCSALEELTAPLEVNSCLAEYFGDDYNGYAAVPSGLSLVTVLFESGTVLDSYAFYMCENVLGVALPESLTEIGANAFEGAGIGGIDLSETALTEIGDSAFKDCENLQFFALPDTATAIGTGILENCELIGAALTFDGSADNAYLAYYFGGDDYTDYALVPYTLQILYILLPEGVTVVPSYALYLCENIQEVHVSDNAEAIGTNVFYQCSSLEQITLCEGIESIDSYAFQNCTSLQEITLPSTLLAFGNSVFSNSGLTSLLIPETVIAIGPNLLYQVDTITSLSTPFTATASFLAYFFGGDNVGTDYTMVPSSLTLLEITGSALYSYACYNCQYLSTIILSDDITAIADYAFSGTGITDIDLSANVASIGACAFNGCASLVSITVMRPSSSTVTSLDATSLTGCAVLVLISVPSGSAGAYQAAANWSVYAAIIS